jgi:hypothetical protein
MQCGKARVRDRLAVADGIGNLRGAFDFMSASALWAETQYAQPLTRLIVRNTTSCSTALNPEFWRKAA